MANRGGSSWQLRSPLRGDFDASRLRVLARKSKHGPQARRRLALAAIYEGATRSEAAKIGGVGLQIIRDWVLSRAASGLEDAYAAKHCRTGSGAELSAASRLLAAEQLTDNAQNLD
jgi:hypothetical protein